MILSKVFRFEAAHRLPRHDGPCRNPHGHSYRLKVSLAVAVDEATGMGCDFADLEEVVNEHVIAHADHQDLNGFLENPTAENICVWIWNRLADQVPGRLDTIELWETEDCAATYRGPGAV